MRFCYSDDFLFCCVLMSISLQTDISNSIFLITRDMRQITYLSKTKYISDWRAPVLTNCIESGLVAVFFSKGLEPLKYWQQHVTDGSIKRITSATVGGLVTEITSSAFCKTYISLPEHPMQKVGTAMPVLNLVVEYLGRPFCFEIQVRDGQNMKRRYRLSTCQKITKCGVLLCHMPLELNNGWNKIGVDLLALTNCSYGTDYAEFLGLQIYANCRLRCVYFSDRKYDEVELPNDYRLEMPKQRCLPEKLGHEVP